MTREHRGIAHLNANYSANYTDFTGESRQINSTTKEKQKTARTSINTGFLAVLAEKKGFEPLRRLPDLLP